MMAILLHHVLDVVILSSLKKMFWVVTGRVIAMVQNIKYTRIFAENFERYAMYQRALSGKTYLSISPGKFSVWPFQTLIRIAVGFYGSNQEFKSGRMGSWHLESSDDSRCLASPFIAVGLSYCTAGAT